MAEETILQQTEDTSPTSDDWLVTWDVTTGTTKKVSILNVLLKILNNSSISFAWQSWTPTWTNMVVSNSTVTAKFTQIGKTVFYRISVVLASTDKPSGSVKFTLPVTSVSYAGTATLPEIGRSGYFIGAFAYRGNVVWSDTTHGQLTVTTASGSYAFDAVLSATVPDTFAAGSEIHISGTYEAA